MTKAIKIKKRCKTLWLAFAMLMATGTLHAQSVVVDASVDSMQILIGEQAKICYDTRLEAEAAALVAQHDYGAPKLSVYHCPYGDHYHLSSTRDGSVAK